MYEDYMQNILGYRMNPQANMNTYEQYNMQGDEWQQYDNYMPMMQQGSQMTSNMNIDLESCYPEIYKIVYPMVRNVCMRNTEPITEEVIENKVVNFDNRNVLVVDDNKLNLKVITKILKDYNLNKYLNDYNLSNKDAYTLIKESKKMGK